MVLVLGEPVVIGVNIIATLLFNALFTTVMSDRVMVEPATPVAVVAPPPKIGVALSSMTLRCKRLSD